MISFAVVDEVKRLLAEGALSQRKIARQVGVSRGTVNAIARGKRPDYKARQEQNDALVAPAGPPARCATCGGLVRMPCLACRVRAIQESRRRPAAREEKRDRSHLPERPGGSWASMRRVPFVHARASRRPAVPG